MPSTLVPFTSVRSFGSLVATADGLATQAGLSVLARGGNAVDAAIAANAALAVSGPHLCGLGGDLFALIHDGDHVWALDAAGRAGSGVDADELRAEGHVAMPFRHDPRTVTVPGCVDGWTLLHERFGRLPLADVLAPAVTLASQGFPASPLLVAALAGLDHRARASLHELATQAQRPGDRVRRPGVARTLATVGEHGRVGFYEGEFGEGLLGLGNGVFTVDDLATSQARWVRPIAVGALGHLVWTVPPPSQGYLALAAIALAERLGIPDDPTDARSAHLLVEVTTAVSYDRPEVLHDAADGDTLRRAATERGHLVSHARASTRTAPGDCGDTTYLCVVDQGGMAVSLIQSNASGFGSWLVEPGTGINLHNRGLGFSLVPGHPAEVASGRRPPHTLAPLLVTDVDGDLRAVLGTMGGDAQPQILLQVLVTLLGQGWSPARSISAPRWVLRGPRTGFDTWSADQRVVSVEGHAPPSWDHALAALGHRVERLNPYDSAFGHAHAIVVEESGLRCGAADPRSVVGSCAGW